ncbi:MAG: tetratricopeptide repeat protein [Candidatus Kariarchaeaceae archaeon]|jgi:tetratricopeptide (TPR) repeat protein
MSNESKLFFADLEDLFNKGNYQALVEKLETIRSPSSLQLIYKAKALRLLGNSNEALELLNNLDVSSDLLISVQSLRERGHILLEFGHYDTAESLINEAFEVFSMIRSQKPEHQNLKADILHSAGNLFSSKGDFQNSLNYWEESLEIKKRLGKTVDQANLLNNIAIYYFVVEEYSKALEFFYEALELTKLDDVLRTRTGILLNIGDTYFRNGFIEKALEYIHQSLESTNNTDLLYIKANCLLALIRCYLVRDDMLHSNIYFRELSKVASETEITSIQLFENYAKALILKFSKDKVDHEQAQSLLTQFLKPSVFDYHTYYDIVLNLLDLHLDNLYSSGDKKVLREIERLIHELYEDAQEKQLFHYAINTLLLKSKIEVVKKETQNFEILLDQAIFMAEDNKFDALRKKVESEKLKMKDKINQYYKFPDKEYSFKERLDICGIRSYIKSELKQV